ncbi:MAG: hypothetical protein AAFP97_02660 [Pseudomonadota bacterium]
MSTPRLNPLSLLAKSFVFGIVAFGVCACSSTQITPIENAPVSVSADKGVSEISDHEDDFRPIKAQIDVVAWGEESYGEALIEPVPMFFGDMNGDGVEDVLAVIYSEVGVSGSIVEPTVFIADGQDFLPYEILGPISGVEPRDVKLTYGAVELTTTVHQDGDAMCCPSGQKTWKLDLDF